MGRFVVNDKDDRLESIVELLHTLQRIESNVLLKLVADRLAHDTGTIIHSLLGLLCLLEEDRDDPANVERMLERMRGEFQRLEIKITDLLEFLRSEAEESDTFFPGVSLERFLQTMGPYFGERRVEIAGDRFAGSDRFRLSGSEEAFLELIWKILFEVPGWGVSEGRSQPPVVRVGFSGRPHAGVVHLTLEGIDVPAAFCTFFKSGPHQRGKLLQFFPTSWMIIQTLLQRFRARMTLRCGDTRVWTMEIHFPGRNT